jgi:hypothetical protein
VRPGIYRVSLTTPIRNFSHTCFGFCFYDIDDKSDKTPISSLYIGDSQARSLVLSLVIEIMP